MGKPGDLSQAANGDGGGNESPNERSVGECSCISRLFGLRCLLVLLLGVSVFLSALFWLPPFSNFSDPDDTDLDPRFRGHAIVASFNLDKPFSFLQDNIPQLESDISDELNILDTKVVILYLDPEPNITKVVFGVDPQTKNSPLSKAAQSLIRSSFASLVINQTSLRLTTSLFGEPYMFEVLKFPGGITIVPPQKAFLLQQIQIQFNFTLNYPILEIQEYFDELRSQLKSGLHLNSNENLYISLTNYRGSTMAPPVTVQTSVLLAVGVNSSLPRLKQLAQTITGSHSKNLGLNHTVFGKVKQVSLSSVLQHSLDNSLGSPAPSPSAYPRPYQHHHHHHHHHDVSAPSSSPEKRHPTPVQSSPSPAPAPVKSYASSPSGCRYGFGRRHRWSAPKQYEQPPTIAPRISPNHHHHHTALPPRHALSPQPVSSRIPSSSPLHHAILAHRIPPPARESDPEPPDKMPSTAPAPAPSNAGLLPTAPWLLSLFITLLLQLWQN